MHEHFFNCPYCNAPISMLLDNSIVVQQYIEDCEVCCNPIEVSIRWRGQELVEFDAIDIEQ